VPPLALALAAVELLPFYFYLTETWRGAHGIEAATAMQYSVPPVDLVQLARDSWAPSPERFMPQIYVGPAVLGLALVGLLVRRPTRALWILVALASVLVVMGSYTSVYPFCTRMVAVEPVAPPRKPSWCARPARGRQAFGSASLMARSRARVGRARRDRGDLRPRAVRDVFDSGANATPCRRAPDRLDPAAVPSPCRRRRARRAAGTPDYGAPRVLNPRGRPIPALLPARSRSIATCRGATSSRGPADVNARAAQPRTNAGRLLGRRAARRLPGASPLRHIRHQLRAR
jgi:hypothetical protein